MPTLAIAMPILPGKLDAFKEWNARKDFTAEFAGVMKQYGLEKVSITHQRNPDGSDLAIIVHEGPDPQKWFTQGMASKSPVLDEWRKMAAEVHGMTPEAPMPQWTPVSDFGGA